MIRTTEVRGVAHLRPAYLHAAVQTHVEMRTDIAVFVAGDDERVLENPPHDIVSWLCDLRFVADENPRPGEDVLLLQLIDLPVVIDVGRDHASANLIEDHGLVGHDTFLLQRGNAPWWQDRSLQEDMSCK